MFNVCARQQKSNCSTVNILFPWCTITVDLHTWAEIHPGSVHKCITLLCSHRRPCSHTAWRLQGRKEKQLWSLFQRVVEHFFIPARAAQCPQLINIHVLQEVWSNSNMIIKLHWSYSLFIWQQGLNNKLQVWVLVHIWNKKDKYSRIEFLIRSENIYI